MFIALYSFKVKPDCENKFVESWTQLTNLIYQYEGSLGSRLHKVEGNCFIAYAQWPDKLTWENSGNNLPQIAIHHKNAMKECCSEIKTEYELNTVVDLLKDTVFDK
ncbi:MAG: antibiotic biosynthesis monooxygenase [Bacteroidetes bacterium]|nr:MAG: antibiotic biosynthesis monooxygenase [Bacteroidota bacterium]